MATPRAVRIPRSPSLAPPSSDGEPLEPRALTGAGSERRTNVGGSQRAVRLAVLFVVALALLYAGFVLYDRSAPGGTAPAAENGVLLFSVVFVILAVGGALFTLTPAPRAVEVGSDRVVVVGRWGRRRQLPALGQLSFRVVRRYPVGWLAGSPVELVEIWGEGIPIRGYLVDAELFAGANASPRG